MADERSLCLFVLHPRSVADIELATKLLRQSSTGAESLLNPIGEWANDWHAPSLRSELLAAKHCCADCLVHPCSDFFLLLPDASYEKLKCGFTPVERTDSQFQMVQDYVKNTHGHTHTQYSLEVLDLFDLDRQGEAEKFSSAGFDKNENVQLLWHGSVSEGEARAWMRKSTH